MPGQQAVARSWPGMWSVSGLSGHLIQRAQQPQPAGEADLLAHVGLVSLSGAADDLKTARWRLGPVQHNTDLHTPTVSAQAAGNISQLADACDAGAATRYERLDNKPQCRAPAPKRWRPAPGAPPRLVGGHWRSRSRSATAQNFPHPRQAARCVSAPIARRPSCLVHSRCAWRGETISLSLEAAFTGWRPAVCPRWAVGAESGRRVAHITFIEEASTLDQPQPLQAAAGQAERGSGRDQPGKQDLGGHMRDHRSGHVDRAFRLSRRRTRR